MQAGKMVMHASGGACFQLLDRGVCRARGEVPVIADFVLYATCRRIESDLHAVLENDRSTGRRHGNHTFAARRVEIDQQVAVGVAHLAALVPAAHAGVARRIGVALRRRC